MYACKYCESGGTHVQQLSTGGTAFAVVPPHVWCGGYKRVVCGSQMASTRQHNKSIVSGTIGTFRLCSNKRLVELDLQRT